MSTYVNKKYNDNSKRKLPVEGRTTNQKDFLRAIRNHNWIFTQGLAGTGKTYCAMGAAVDALNRGKIENIIICRAIAHHSKVCGHTTGSYKEKAFQNFKQPVKYLKKFMGPDGFKKAYDHGVIELNAIELIRGENYNSWTIIEEAQECTKEQLILAQTRIDIGGKLIITGDYTQGHPNCYFKKLMIAPPHEHIIKITFTENDIQRHKEMYSVYKYMKNIG